MGLVNMAHSRSIPPPGGYVAGMAGIGLQEVGAVCGMAGRSQAWHSSRIQALSEQ